jgi:hypothetical protein
MANSAYRSGLIVKSYKNAYERKYGKNNAYYDVKKNMHNGLNRWFAEKWRNESGKIGYDKKNILYRPTVRISKDTPKTWKELTNREIIAAKKEKRKNGRINKF